ncbi:MAG: hypothetical protein K2X69_09185 [Silvanigrellaceae bacterium]|nr:hypothetical protein [Silvanigrellaceae bacterium]
MSDFLYIKKKLKIKNNQNNIILDNDTIKNEVNDAIDSINYILKLMDGGMKSSDLVNPTVLNLLKLNYVNIRKFFQNELRQM